MHRTILALLLSTAAAAQGPVPVTAPDPIEGKWLGTAGFPGQDTITLGIEFRRDSAGQIAGYLSQPVLNYYDFKLPGVVVRDSGRYVLAAYDLKGTIQGNELVGTYFPFNAPMRLQRVRRLPTEVPVPTLPPGPAPRWKRNLGGGIFANVAIRDGVAYVGTGAGVLYAVRVADGEVRWHAILGRPLYGAALVTDDALYITCDDGYLYKLALADGKEVWRYDLGDARSSRILPHSPADNFDWDYHSARPLLADSVLYVGAGDGSFHAVAARDGHRVWRAETKGRIRNDAVLDGDRVIVGSWDGSFYAFDRSTGAQRWTKPTGYDITSTPAIAGRQLVVGNRGGLLASIDLDSLRARWRVLLWGSSVESDPVVVGDTIFVGSSDMRRVNRFDLATGRVVWRTDVYGLAWARVLVTPATIYAGVLSTKIGPVRHLGSLVALDRRTGQIRWRWPTPLAEGAFISGFQAGPEIDGKTLVIGSVDGTLYGFPVE